MNDAEGLQKSRAGYFKLGRTGGGLGRRRGGQRKDQGNAAGPRVSSASTCRAAWVPPLREVGGGPLADSPRPLGRGPAGSRRCGRCGSPHSVRGLFTSPTGSRVGRGRGGGRSWTAGLQVPAGRPGAGPAGGEGVWGRCGNSSLPGHGPTGVGAVGGAGPRGGPRPSCHPGRSRTRAGGAGAGLGPAPAARGRHPELVVRRWSAGRGREQRVGRDQQRTRAEGEWGLTGGRAGHSGDNPE